MSRTHTLVKLITLIVIASLAVLPSTAAAPTAISPPLGAADTFAILAATAITSVPTSAIIGDVGLSPATGGNYTGLTALEVTGTIYAVDAAGPAGSVMSDTLLTNAKNDLGTAYDGLASQACTTTYPDATKELSGENLVPGVYCADNFMLSGTLILNGADTDVWVFKSAGALTVFSPAAQIVLSTGGIPCEVWWQVSSSASLGTNTSFVGNILALTSITLATGAHLDGRALARNADVTLQSNSIAIPICTLDVPTITTEIHDDSHTEVFAALIGTVVHDMAMISGTLGITPTGTVTFTLYANQACTGTGTFAGAIPLVAIASGVSVADPSDTAILTAAGLSYRAYYGGDHNYDPGNGPCEVLRPMAVPIVTTEIHDANHIEVTSAPTGTVVHDMARVTGTLGIPTGIVSFTVYHNQACTGTGTFAGAIPLDAVGVADPSYTATLTDAGLSYLARYMGDVNYIPANGPCEMLAVAPTAVELLYFQATPLNDRQVQLEWATALEVDNFGFKLYRANVNDVRLAEPIHFEPASTQGGGSGATYGHVDTAPYAGQWWYWLSDVDTYGRETFHNTPTNITVESNSDLPYRIYLPLIASP